MPLCRLPELLFHPYHFSLLHHMVYTMASMPMTSTEFVIRHTKSTQKNYAACYLNRPTINHVKGTFRIQILLIDVIEWSLHG